MEINSRRQTSSPPPSLQAREEAAHLAVASFDGVGGLTCSGRRSLLRGTRLIAKAEILTDGRIELWVVNNGWSTHEDVRDFEQRLGEVMAEHIR